MKISPTEFSHYKNLLLLANREKDPLLSSQLKAGAKKQFMKCKDSAWKNYVEKCAANRNHFKLAQAMFKKEFLKVNKHKKPIKFPDARCKKPTISDSIESTRERRSEF